MSKPAHHFYGGSHWIKSAKVRKLPATSFKELTELCFFSPVSLRMTRAEFFALPKDERDAIKAGPYLTAASFKEDECQRNTENADRVMLVCLDLDGGTFAKDIDEAPEALSDALFPLNFVAYRTASHTPEDPHLRIIVEVKPCAIQHYRLLVRHVAFDRIGLPREWKGRTESKVVVQPMGRPVQFEGEEFTAVITSRTNGIALDYKKVSEVSESLEEGEDRTYAYLGDPDANDDFDLAYCPIPDLKVEDIREALFTIDSDCPRSEWISIGLSLRHQFRREDEAEEAFTLFHDWSFNDGASTRYKGEKDTYAQWRSFRPDCRAGRPVTIRSLYHHAQQAGWQHGKAAFKIQQDIVAFLETCKTVNEVSEGGCRRILQMPFKDEIAESSVVTAMMARLKKLGSPTARKVIEEQLRRLHREKKAAEDDDGFVPPWLMPWCYVNTLDRFYHTTTGIFLTPEAFNRTFEKELMPKEADSEAAKAGRPSILPSSYGLNLKDMKKVDGVLYDPRKGAYFAMDGKQWANEYRESTVPREVKKKVKWVEKVVRKLLNHIIREPEYVEIVINWMAFVVQNPGVKCRWCILIQSAEGAGKGVLGNIIGAAIGSKNIKFVGPESLAEPKFNDWMGGAQVIVLDEIWVSGMGRADTMNRLKPFHTNNVIPYIRKHCGQINIDNVANAIAFTNHHNGLYITSKDRRYCVIKSTIQTEEAAEAMVEANMFDDPVKVCEEEAGSLRWWLLNHPIPASFDPNGRAPHTIYKDEMVRASKNRLQIEIEDLVADETEPRIASDIIDLSVLVAHTGRSERNATPEHFLTELGYHEWQGGRMFGVNGHKTKVWVHRENHDPFFGDPVEILNERCHAISEKEL